VLHRVLVIYGDRESRLLLNQVLSPTYDVVAVPYFPTVIASILSPIKPDLVVLDTGLAGQPVQDLCRQIRKESKNVPLFVLGARESADRIIVLDLGADDYITKPINSTEFLVGFAIRSDGGLDTVPVSSMSDSGQPSAQPRSHVFTSPPRYCLSSIPHRGLHPCESTDRMPPARDRPHSGRIPPPQKIGLKCYGSRNSQRLRLASLGFVATPAAKSPHR
jgi:CheY-like chemotaxis protein